MKNTTPLYLTCDRDGDLLRAALWHGKELEALAFDAKNQPDISGALYSGKVVRVVPSQKMAFVDCGLPPMVSVPMGSLRAGDYVDVEIKAPSRQGKAMEGRKIGESKETKIALLQPAPPAWLKLLRLSKAHKPSAIIVSDKTIHAEISAYLSQSDPDLLSHLEPLSKEPPHPQLDEMLDQLTAKTVLLSKGGSLVIEETEALVAIDINGGSYGSALEANMAALREALRQIHLRNLSGIIVIDCLKMQERGDAAKLLNLVELDAVSASSVSFTKLGLLEFVRERRGLSLSEILGRRN